MTTRILLLLLSIPSVLSSQPFVPDMAVFAERREAFMKELEAGAYAIFPSMPVYPRNNDVDHDYRQESNFYYLSGFEEPESILLLNPSAPRYRYVMFVRNRDKHRETWEGIRAGQEGAMSHFRADTALAYSDFKTAVRKFINASGTLYYTFGINEGIDVTIREICIGRWVGYNCTIADPAQILARMRVIKSEGDWNSGFRRAVEISVQAHLDAMKAIRPEMYELEVQGVFESTFRRLGSPRNGYPCIVGSGPNSCILHYSENSRKMHGGEVILMDCAAEYGYYSADITRTVPVNGTFSREQATLYNIVLRAQEEGISRIRPGITRGEVDSVITEVLSSGLMDLGFIKEKKDARTYTLHGYSHWLGLDVHDTGPYTENGKSVTLRPGMVFTIEPGIYVRPDVLEDLKGREYSDEELDTVRRSIEPFLNIGIRIEDDILVTENGFRNLSADVPRTIEEIERVMKGE